MLAPSVARLAVRGAITWTLVVLAACASSDDTTDVDDASRDTSIVDVASETETVDDGERALRDRLGIPADARRVLVFAQNAHLDIDWQDTFDGYYTRFVGAIFDHALTLLERDARAHYSIAEMAFLERHVRERPEDVARIRAALDRGVLHIVGGLVTSPDTLLPETELVMRDALHGARFAEDALGARPARTAWLPDSFGHAATSPDLLAAIGYGAVALSRVDGEPTIYQWIAALMSGPRPGSTGAALRALGSADFVWRGPGGAEVIAHFMSSPGLYCQGDNIDYDEPIQIAGGHIGPFRGDSGFTDAAIDRYAAELEPMGLTPYRFVPVGCDFQFPKVELLDYLEGYNTRRYPTTGVYAVAASFEEYVALIGLHRDALPVLETDLTPYFMGFYATRVGLKQRIRDATRALVAADLLAVVAGEDADATLRRRDAWWRLTWTNHHDFVTGTAADRVVDDEQEPLVAAVAEQGGALLATLGERLSARVPAAPGATRRRLDLNPAGQAQAGVPAFGWRIVDDVDDAPAPIDDTVTVVADDDHIVLSNARVRATLERLPERGWLMTSLALGEVEALAGPSFDVWDYEDDGGLWRLGHEMDGCRLTPIARVDPTTQVVIVTGDAGERRVVIADASLGVTRELRLAAGDAGPELVVEGALAIGRTRTARFTVVIDDADRQRTSVAGGIVRRPLERVFAPTWWPAVDWAASGSWAVLLRATTGVRFGADGLVELMVNRDARSEKCDVLGGTGSDPGAQRVAWRIVSLAGNEPEDAIAVREAEVWNRPLVHLDVSLPAVAPVDPMPRSGSVVAVADGVGLVTAVKPADRGAGVIVRVALSTSGALTLALGPMLRERRARKVDAAERDLGPLGTDPVGSTLVLEPSSAPAPARGMSSIITTRFE